MSRFWGTVTWKMAFYDHFYNLFFQRSNRLPLNFKEFTVGDLSGHFFFVTLITESSCLILPNQSSSYK